METQESVPWWTLRYEAMASFDPNLLGFEEGTAEYEVELAVSALGLKAGEQVLDVACGTGVHARSLHQRGFPTTGLDLSPRLLRVARTRWESPEPGPTWMPGDMRWLPRSGPFDAVTLFGPSLGFFEDDDDHRRCLASILDVLRPGGRMLCNLFNPYYWATRAATTLQARDPEGLTVDIVKTPRFDIQRGRVEERAVIFAESGRHELPTASIRAWTPPELQSMFRAAGFRKVSVHGTEGFAVPDELIPAHPTESVFFWVLAEV